MNIIVLLLVIVCAVCAMRLWQQGKVLAVMKKREQVRTAFIRNLSREIRTPLHTVSGLAEVISNEQLYLSKSEKKNISDQIKANSDLIGTILDEVMYYVDNTSGGHKIKDERLSPNSLCRSSLQAFQQRSTDSCAAKIAFKRTMSDDVFVNTDPHIVQLILNKLMFNACHFTQEGEVAMGCSTSENPGKLTIYVQDTGCGIPEDRKQSVFSWFDHPNDNIDMAEMDLSIAQRLAHRLGGEVMLDPKYTGGTRVLLILPMK